MAKLRRQHVKGRKYKKFKSEMSTGNPSKFAKRKKAPRKFGRKSRRGSRR